MKHYAGLDVSVKETAICIVDENGRICREAKVVSHPEDLSNAISETGYDSLTLAVWWSFCAPKGCDNPSKPRPEVREDLSDVVAAGAEDGKEGITNRAFQRARSLFH